MSKRAELRKQIQSNQEMIEKLRAENLKLQREDWMLSDETQWYEEKEILVTISKRPKVVEKQIRGFIKWNQEFKDEATGESISIERSQVVKINGKFVNYWS